MLYREYDEKTLKKLQKTELEILKDFDELCRENGLSYFGGGGTAIGAVRHKGMIPWDDDIDVGLVRKDYVKFLRIAKQKKWREKYNVINAETMENYPLMSTRWCKKGTKFKEDALKTLDGDLGIFLDVYCFDNIPDNELLMKIHGWRSWFWGKLLILYWLDEPVLYFDGFLGKAVTGICKGVHLGMRGLHISPRWLYRHTKRVTTCYDGKETRRVNYMHDPRPFISIMNKSDIFPVRRMEFSGQEICVPAKVEAYLDRRFGDYMTLPPEEKRHNHPPYELDFGEE